jgi:hypothetical protein
LPEVKTGVGHAVIGNVRKRYINTLCGKNEDFMEDK